MKIEENGVHEHSLASKTRAVRIEVNMGLCSSAPREPVPKATYNKADGALETYKFRVSHGGCSGSFWRGNPLTGAGPPNGKRWPRNGSMLKGVVVVAPSGQKHLRVVEMQPAGKKEWEEVDDGKWMPFDGGPSNGGKWLHPL